MWPALRGLFSLPLSCLGCGLPETEIKNAAEFHKGDVDLIVCELCGRDYFEWSGETIVETVARSGANPAELIFWRRRH
jgi:hypothetical protein